MPDIDLHARALALQERITALPAGSIAMKKVNGKTYAYHRWTENKKRYDKYVPADQVDTLRAKIEERKALEEELRMLNLGESTSKSARTPNFTNEASFATSQMPERGIPKIAISFATNVLVGDVLRPFTTAVRNLPRRAGVEKIESYLRAQQDECVFIVTGLRCTGRSTMIRQALAGMSPIALAHTAFIQAASNMSMDELTRDLRSLAEIGVKYIFINEPTLFSGFMERASILADFFTSAGMRIVLSSSDPLVMMLLAKKRLYNRATLLSTSFLPFREAINIFRYQSIEEYLQVGGTTLPTTFSEERSAVAYFDESVIECILRARMQSEVMQVLGDVPESQTVHMLHDAYDSLNKRFLSIEVQRSFLPPANATPEELLEYFVMDVLRNDLSSCKEAVEEVAPFWRTFQALGLLREIPLVRFMGDATNEDVSVRTVCLLPGLRYVGVKTLVHTLLATARFRVLPYTTREAIEKRLLERISRRLLEDLVLLETQEALKRHRVTCVELPDNSSGMVVQDPLSQSCTFFLFDFVNNNQEEINTSVKTSFTQIEHRLGRITDTVCLTLQTRNSEREELSSQSVEAYLLALLAE